MGSSFTGFRGHGFWARDGILETWLAALADVVPADASGWLAVAARHWREQAGVGFTGCVDAGLDALLDSPVRAELVLDLTRQAAAHVADLSDGDGFLPAAWLNSRHISGQVTWSSDSIRGQYVQQVADAFARLVDGGLQDTPRTSPMLPRLAPPSSRPGGPGTLGEPAMGGALPSWCG